MVLLGAVTGCGGFGLSETKLSPKIVRSMPWQFLIIVRKWNSFCREAYSLKKDQVIKLREVLQVWQVRGNQGWQLLVMLDVMGSKRSRWRGSCFFCKTEWVLLLLLDALAGAKIPNSLPSSSLDKLCGPWSTWEFKLVLHSQPAKSLRNILKTDKFRIGWVQVLLVTFKL